MTGVSGQGFVEGLRVDLWMQQWSWREGRTRAQEWRENEQSTVLGSEASGNRPG